MRWIPGWLVTVVIVIVVIILLAIVIAALGGFSLDIGHFRMGVTK